LEKVDNFLLSLRIDFDANTKITINNQRSPEIKKQGHFLALMRSQGMEKSYIEPNEHETENSEYSQRNIYGSSPFLAPIIITKSGLLWTNSLLIAQTRRQRHSGPKPRH